MKEDNVGFHNSNVIITCYVLTVRMMIFEIRFLVSSIKYN